MSVAQLTQTPRFSETRSLRITRNMQNSHGLTVDLWISVNHSMISVIFSANSRAAPLQNAEADHRVSNITLLTITMSTKQAEQLTNPKERPHQDHRVQTGHHLHVKSSPRCRLQHKQKKILHVNNFYIYYKQKSISEKKLQTAFLVVDVSHAMAAGVIWTVKPTKQHEVNSQWHKQIFDLYKSTISIPKSCFLIWLYP